MQKKIILGVQKTANIYKSIIQNLELYGFEVHTICFSDDSFQYKNFQQRFVNLIRKVFLNDKHYKNTLKFKGFEKEVLHKINQIKGQVDYTLIIRADIYPKKILQLLKEKSKMFTAYQWDGLSRYPAIYDYIPMFDRFFVFEKKDLLYKNNLLLPTINFYFDYDTNFIKNEDCSSDVFFIGAFFQSRMASIIKFVNKATEIGLKLDFYIRYSQKDLVDKYAHKNINYIDESINYKDSIRQLKKSKIIVDFLNDSHEGLSLRVLESLLYSKKIITTNHTVKKYDFYHPNNMFIWDGEKMEGFEEFIDMPYVKIDEDIRLKYGFKNWINYILDIPPYQEIDLP